MVDWLTAMIDMAPRPLTIGAHSMLNAGSRLSAQFRRQREGFGMCGAFENVTAVLSALASGLTPARPLPPTPVVVELGPGRTPHIAAAFALCGASSVSSFDVVSILDDAT